MSNLEWYVGKKVEITKGRDRGEIGTVVGYTGSKYSMSELIIDLDFGGTTRVLPENIRVVEEGGVPGW